MLFRLYVSLSMTITDLKRKTTVNYRLNHFTLSSPVFNNLATSLPTEVLMMIFEIARRLSYPRTRKRNRFEVTISHVSQRWRSIALEMPSLWTSIHRDSYQECLNSSAAYIARSTTLQLDVQIVIGSSGPKRDGITAFMMMIAPHLFRCRNLFVFSQSRQEFLSFLIFISTIHVPVLDSLRLHCTDTIYPKAHIQLFSPGAPALKQLLMTGVDIRSCRPPLNSLIAFSLKIPTPSSPNIVHIKNVLSHMPFLVHLELTNPELWSNDAPVYFGALRYLKLTFSKYGRREGRGEQFHSVLEGINAPLLEIVKITGAMCHGACSNPSLLQLQSRRSFPSVQYIVLDDCFDHMDIVCLRDFALLFPNLSQLACTANPDTSVDFYVEPLVEVLMESRRMVWAQLRSLAVDQYVMQEDKLSVALMKKIYFARREMNSPIRELQVPEDCIPKLKCLLTRATSSCLQICVFYEDFPVPFHRTYRVAKYGVKTTRAVLLN